MVRKAKKLQPTELELLILKVLWAADDADAVGELPMAVRDIRRGLAVVGRELAHTSVITTLNIMVDKSFLIRTKRKNAFLFSPRVARGQVQAKVLGDVLDRVFDGSAENLMLALLDHNDVDASSLAEIRRIINRKAKDSVGD